MRTFKLTIAYDGAAYCGWQRQPALPSVQSTLEVAWGEFTAEKIIFRGASRTDSGVHAQGQVAAVESETQLRCDVIVSAMNAHLPEDIVVLNAEIVAPTFNAISSAKGKQYRYQIHNSRLKKVIGRNYYWHIPSKLDIAAMHDVAQLLKGKHDFASFQTTGSPRTTTVRTIFDISVQAGQGRGEENAVLIKIEGDGFLYNMVRSITGTIVAVGQGARSKEWFQEVFKACDRSKAGQTAPACGLFLVRVNY